MYFGDHVAANIIGKNISISLHHTDRLQFANRLLRTKKLKYAPKMYKRDQLNFLTSIGIGNMGRGIADKATKLWMHGKFHT